MEEEDIRGLLDPRAKISHHFSPFHLIARSRAIAMGGGASGAHSSYTGVQALKVESGEGMSGEDRDFYGDAAVDLKFGSVATDASVPTGLDSVDSKDSKMKEQDMDKKIKKDEIKTFEGTEEDRAGEFPKQS